MESWWEVILNTQIIGVIVGAVIAYFMPLLGRVKIEYIPDSKYELDPTGKVVEGSFMVDIINMKQTSIVISEIYFVDEGKTSHVSRVIDTNSTTFDPILVSGRTAQRVVLKPYDENHKSMLIFVVNGRRRKIKRT